jgi:type VI secretion system protein ImpE
MGPCLEVITNGKYYWVPFNRIQSISIEEPEDLRDFVWTAAYFTWMNGGQSVGLIPTRYPGSQDSEDDKVRLSKKTEWEECEADVFLGKGQRMLATDEGEYSLMDIREIKFDTGPDVQQDSPAEES